MRRLAIAIVLAGISATSGCRWFDRDPYACYPTAQYAAPQPAPYCCQPCVPCVPTTVQCAPTTIQTSPATVRPALPR